MPVNINLVDGVVMAFTAAPWRYNFEGGAPATVTYRGQPHRSRGALVQMTPEEMGHAVRNSLDSGGSAQRMGIRAPKGTSRPRPNSPHWDPRSAPQWSGSS